MAMMEMVINGVSTRKVSLVTEELCGCQFSKSTVSALCKNLDPVVKSWNHRPLTDRYPFVVVDAMVTKVREDGRIRARGLLLAFGVNSEGLGLTRFGGHPYTWGNLKKEMSTYAEDETAIPTGI